MYGLFFYHYDWYEWEELQGVSKRKSHLTKYAKQIDRVLAKTEEEHLKYADEERFHLFIKKVLVIGE